MKDLFKNGFLLGLGAALYGKEKLDDLMKSMIEKGMVSQTEANSLFSDFLKRGEEKSGSWNQQYREMVQSQLKDLGFVGREEIDNIQSQLLLLQQEIVQLKNNTTNEEQK
jgi:polyhydroxyalkanoate synthesis regulator phasin